MDSPSKNNNNNENEAAAAAEEGWNGMREIKSHIYTTYERFSLLDECFSFVWVSLCFTQLLQNYGLCMKGKQSARTTIKVCSCWKWFACGCTNILGTYFPMYAYRPMCTEFTRRATFTPEHTYTQARKSVHSTGSSSTSTSSTANH